MGKQQIEMIHLIREGLVKCVRKIIFYHSEFSSPWQNRRIPELPQTTTNFQLYPTIEIQLF